MDRAPRIVVIGSANMDLTTFTDCFPQPGETVFGRGFQLGFGGKGANQAVAAKLCGAEVSMLARVGDDLFGTATIRNFESRGVDARHVLITPGASTGVAPIFVDAAGQNRIIVIKGANDLLLPADIDAAADLLQRADCILLQFEIPLETVYYALRFARRHGIRTILNPAPAGPVEISEVAQADYVIPNETEAAALAAMPVRTLEEACFCGQALVERGFARVIVTLGSNGALFAAAGQAPIHVPVHPTEAIDTSGAGDAFVGAFACFLAQSCEELDAVRRANVYAALSTRRTGTQISFVRWDQIRDLY